jgi:serine protease Do
MKLHMKPTFLLAALAPSLVLLADEKPAEKPEPKKEEVRPAAPLMPAVEQKPNPVDELQLPVLAPLIADVRLSTVQLLSRNWSKPICQGIVVHEQGWVISKASEVDKFPEVDAKFSTSDQFPAGLRLPVKLVSRHKDYDLALLKMDASGFKPVRWSSQSPPVPGSMLVAGSIETKPLAFGVASVDVRNMDLANRGFLGLQLSSEKKILSIVPDSPAARAGLATEDLILKINDEAIGSVEDFQETIAKYKPADNLTVEFQRAKEVKKVEAKLQRRSDFPNSLVKMEDPRNGVSGNLSIKRDGFPAALQHDLPLKPEDCGGPLVDLDGNVVGINIARSGRIDSMAIPAQVLIELLKDVPKGRFYIPEVESLKKAIADMEQQQKKANDEKDRIKQLEEKLSKGLEEARKRVDAVLGKLP